jgi:hypothetical protein
MRPEWFPLPPFRLAWFSASDRRDLERLKAEPVSFASQFANIVKRSWTREEDGAIIEFVSLNGPRNWVKLAELLPERAD